MTDNTASTRPGAGKLAAAIVRVRDEMADGEDNVVELRTAEAARLQLLADDLAPVFEAVDDGDERFELAMSNGERPRLWIDMTTFVAMGKDRRTYRLLKDTRMGRIVLQEDVEREPMAHAVTDYVARRVLERERAIEGEWIAVRSGGDPASATTAQRDAVMGLSERAAAPRKRAGMTIGWYLFGVLCGMAAVLAAAYLIAPQAFAPLLDR